MVSVALISESLEKTLTEDSRLSLQQEHARLLRQQKLTEAEFKKQIIELTNDKETQLIESDKIRNELDELKVCCVVMFLI
jgi:hypothetical protein